MSRIGVLTAAVAASLALGAPVASLSQPVTKSEKAIPATRQPKIHKRGNWLTGKKSASKHKGAREKARRLAQIARGSLTASNGLAA